MYWFTAYMMFDSVNQGIHNLHVYLRWDRIQVGCYKLDGFYIMETVSTENMSYKCNVVACCDRLEFVSLDQGYLF